MHTSFFFFLDLSVLYLHNYFVSFRPGEEEQKGLAHCSVGRKLGCSSCPSSPSSPGTSQCWVAAVPSMNSGNEQRGLDKCPALERPLYSWVPVALWSNYQYPYNENIVLKLVSLASCTVLLKVISRFFVCLFVLFFLLSKETCRAFGSIIENLTCSQAVRDAS